MTGDGDVESRRARPERTPVGGLGDVDGSPDRRGGRAKQPLCGGRCNRMAMGCEPRDQRARLAAESGMRRRSLRRKHHEATMRRMALLLLLMAGCSTAPVADVMDYFSPGRMDKAQVTPYGGVCLQTGKGPPLNAIPIIGRLYREARLELADERENVIAIFPVIIVANSCEFYRVPIIIGKCAL